MNRLSFVLDHRGLRNSVARGLQVGTRFGLTAVKMERRLAAYADLVGQYGAYPSLPITAAVLDRNPHVARRLLDKGVELCVHGLVHNDLSRLDRDIQKQQIEEAIGLFRKHDIDFSGFRSPYLRYNDATLNVIEECGFEYDSNLPFYWEPPDSFRHLTGLESDGLERGLLFYKPVKYPQDRSLPRFTGGLVELPVSLPDDEILLDRMGWAPPKIGEIWQEVASMALDRGELFTVQLHPERMLLLRDSLKQVLDFAKSKNDFWIATMGEIARWWKQRTAMELVIIEDAPGSYTVAIEPEAVVGEPPHPGSGGRLQSQLLLIEAASGRRQPVTSGSRIRSARRPVIGLHPETDKALMYGIRDQGYVVELSADPSPYPVHFDPGCDLGHIKAAVAGLDHPLVADSYWPVPFRAALAVTGDIDCLTLGDFVRRFREG